MSTCGRGAADRRQTADAGPGRVAAARGTARMKSGVVVLVMTATLAIAGAAAQEGHPLVGTWRGAWGPSAAERHDLTVVMEYDGRQVTGVINPGFESMRLQTVTLDPATWTVRLETEATAGNKKVPVVIQAKFEDLTNRHRSLVGTWVQGTTKGDFRITLD